MDWIGLDWIGLDWIGLDWIGLGWIGLDFVLLVLLGFVIQFILSPMSNQSHDFADNMFSCSSFRERQVYGLGGVVSHFEVG